MKIWLPTIRARSGADVYMERHAAALRERGAEPVVEWLPHAYQYAPWLLRKHPAPPGTDIVHAVSWSAFAFAHRRAPLVVTTLHCVAGRGYPEWKSFPQMLFHDQFVRRFERASFRAADAVVAISESTAREVGEDYGTEHVRTIPLWVDTLTFSPLQSAPRTRATTTQILIVGNMSRRKGGDLIAPFCNALGSNFGVTVVVGLRGERPAVTAQGAGLQFARGLTRAQLVDVYRNADIVVSLSRHEGFGYTALEGMACGKPIVAFNVSGLRDVIVDRETGLLASVDDVAMLAAHCRTLRERPAQADTMGKAGRQRAVTVFAKKRAIDTYLQIYSELLAR